MENQTKEYYIDKLYHYCHDNLFPIDLEKQKLVTYKFFEGFYDSLRRLSFNVRCIGDNIIKPREVYTDIDVLEEWAYECEETFLKKDGLILKKKEEISYIEGSKWCFKLIKVFIILERRKEKEND